MTKKRSTHDEGQTIPTPATPRSRDRHKPRRSIFLPPGLHAQLTELAKKNRRPLRWEVIVALEDHLAKHGFCPPDPDADA